MRLKNKKTGEIVEAHEIDLIDKYVYLKIFRAGDYDTKQYNSLAELNAEWEDMPEEPKEYWYINEFGTPTKADFVGRETLYDKCRKNFGNYFETKEEAERVVERLRAWKRLKDFGCRFILDDHFAVKFVGPDATKITSAEEQGLLSDAYKLLFGGEE